MTAVGICPKPSPGAVAPGSVGPLQNNVHARDLGCAHDLPPGCGVVVDGDAAAIIDAATAKRMSSFEIGPMPVSTRAKYFYFHELSAENRAGGDVFVTLPSTAGGLAIGR